MVHGMGAIATLAHDALEVAPGGEATASIRVRNAGSIVDEFTFEVLGPASSWTVVEPEVLRLLPGDEAEARITMRPPRSSGIRAGETGFAVKVNAREDPAGSVVEEGMVVLGGFDDLTADLIPHTSQGARVGRHELAVDNRGNGLLQTDIVATDPDERLAFVVREPVMALEPGTAAFTELEVRPRERFWRGPNQTLPFSVHVGGGEGVTPVVVDGAMVQRAILPPWLLKALLALLALLLLLWLLWALLLRPTIESTAEEAADEAAATAVEEALEEPLAEQSEQVAGLAEAVEELAEEGGGQPTEAPGGGGDGGPDATPTTEATPSPATTVNTDLRLAAADAAGGPVTTDSFTVPAGQSFALTDIVLQNPRGNEGLVRVLRGGDPLLVVAQENFRDLDYHFVSPILFGAGESIVLEVDCEAVTAPGASNCRAAAYISGTTTEAG